MIVSFCCLRVGAGRVNLRPKQKTNSFVWTVSAQVFFPKPQTCMPRQIRRAKKVTPVYLGALNALLKSLCILLFFSGRKGAVRNLKHACLKREIPKIYGYWTLAFDKANCPWNDCRSKDEEVRKCITRPPIQDRRPIVHLLALGECKPTQSTVVNPVAVPRIVKDAEPSRAKPGITVFVYLFWGKKRINSVIGFRVDL